MHFYCGVSDLEAGLDLEIEHPLEPIHYRPFDRPIIRHESYVVTEIFQTNRIMVFKPISTAPVTSVAFLLRLRTSISSYSQERAD